MMPGQNPANGRWTGERSPVSLVDYLRLATGYLEKGGTETARLDAEVLLGDVLGMDRMSLYVNFDRPLDPKEVDRFRTALQRRFQGEPVAYIIGRRQFMTLMLAVSSDVLIPRPETELLVETVLEQILERGSGVRTAVGGAGNDSLAIADIGTGSGAIAISLAAARPDAAIVAVDISEPALTVARRNAETYGVHDQIEFVSGNLLAPLLHSPEVGRYAESLDAVVSNPPYVTTEEWGELAKDVRDFEPRLALDGGPDGLAAYRGLVAEAPAALKPGGFLALEIGAAQGAAVVNLLQATGGWQDVRVLRDYAGCDRVVVATKRL